MNGNKTGKICKSFFDKFDESSVDNWEYMGQAECVLNKEQNTKNYVSNKQTKRK